MITQNKESKMKTSKKWLAVAVMLLSMTIFNGCNTYRPGTDGNANQL
jgi:predicted small secreted protein